MNELLRDKLKKLPHSPGVYFHKDASGEIIYVGKAAVLKNRVRQYFQNKDDADPKTKALVAEIYDTDWIETESETDALFLESEMIKRYTPKYNVLLRDDKSQIYIRINMKDEWPYVSFTRNPLDDKSEYFGPYYSSYAIKKSLRYLRKTFPYYIKPHKETDRLTLDAHIGLEPYGISSDEYHRILRNLIGYIKGNRTQIINNLEADMKKAAGEQNFELAARIRNRLRNLYELKKRIMFGDKEFLSISKDVALMDTVELFSLKKIPKRIEGYDVSHMSGTNVVASMVVFTNGVSDRAEYRKFKTRNQINNDFLNMRDTITRRFSLKNISSWGKPDFILIDGGKGQLDSAIDALRDNDNMKSVPIIGLAKKNEEIIINDNFSNIDINSKKLELLGGFMIESGGFTTVKLSDSTHIIKLFQRIRDESHRFAVSYHTTLKRKQQVSSIFDEMSGIGPRTKQILLKKYGSIKVIATVPNSELVKLIGEKKANIINAYLKK